MNSKKVILVLLIVLTLLCTLNIKSFAADSYSATLTPSSTRVSKGSEVTVTLKLSNINVQDGISAVEATLKYDSDVLSINEDDVKALNGWAIEYNASNSKMTIDNSDSITEDTEIATFTFTVEENTSATTTAVSLVSVAAGNATLSEKVSISDITTNLQISSGSLSPSSSPSSTPTSTATTTPSATTSTTPSATVTPTSSTNANAVTTVTDGNMPATGADNYILPLMAIIAVLGVISFIGYKRIDDK